MISDAGILFLLEERAFSMKRLLSVLSVFAITCVGAGTASAGPIISTPTGLVAGDQFRIVFVTTSTTAATDTTFSTYDNLVPHGLSSGA